MLLLTVIEFCLGLDTRLQFCREGAMSLQTDVLKGVVVNATLGIRLLGQREFTLPVTRLVGQIVVSQNRIVNNSLLQLVERFP